MNVGIGTAAAQFLSWEYLFRIFDSAVLRINAFWCGSGSGSGSADPCLWLWIQILLFSSLTFKMPTKTNFVFKVFLLITFWRYICIIFKDKKSKRSQSSRNQGFSYYFCLVIEGSGSIPLTNGSSTGSRRPKKHVDPVDSDSDPQHCDIVSLQCSTPTQE